MLDEGCWSSYESFSLERGADWHAEFSDATGRTFVARHGNETAAAEWQLAGAYNLENALAAIAAAHSAGVSITNAAAALSRFTGVKRRLERTAEVAGIFVYDDFAHHPTAIRRTIEGVKARYPGERLFVALEPRSNTMKLGVHDEALVAALAAADHVAVFRPEGVSAGFDTALAGLGEQVAIYRQYDALVAGLKSRLRPGDHMVFMSNGGFGAVRQKLTAALETLT